MNLDHERLRRALNLAMRHVYSEAALLAARPCDPSVARDQRPDAVLWSWIEISGAWTGTVALVQPLDLAVQVVKQAREGVREPVPTDLLLEIQGDLTTRMVAKTCDQLFSGGAKAVLAGVQVGNGAPDVRRGNWQGHTWAVGGWWVAAFVHEGALSAQPTPTAPVAGEFAPATERVTNPQPLTKVVRAKGEGDVAWPDALPRRVAPAVAATVAKPVVAPVTPSPPPHRGEPSGNSGADRTLPSSPSGAQRVIGSAGAASGNSGANRTLPSAPSGAQRVVDETGAPVTPNPASKSSSASGRRNVVRTIDGLLSPDTARSRQPGKPPTTSVVGKSSDKSVNDADRTAPWFKSAKAADKRTDFAVPEVLGHYRVERVLGEGGMGVVVKASHTNLDRQVAIKLMKPALAGNPAFAAGFMREARIAASLEHPNLVTVYDAAQEGGFLYMALRFMGGGDLTDQLRREGQLSEPRAIHMFSQLLAALQYINSKHLIHRDIKPANVLLDSDFTPRLGDLGLVRTSKPNSDPADNDRMGTPAYMSPEQLYGDRELDIRSDIYSMGLTLYVALTCHQPLQAPDLETTIANVLQVEPPDPRTIVPNLSEAMTQVVMKAIRKRPQDRFQTPKEFLEALTAVEHEALNELSASGVSWFGKIFGGRR